MGLTWNSGLDPIADRLLVHLQLRGDLRDGEELFGLSHRGQGYATATGLRIMHVPQDERLRRARASS